MRYKFYKQAVRAAEIGYEWTRTYRDSDPSSPTYGGYRGGYLNGDTGIVESGAWGSGIAFANALALYLCEDSPYHGSGEVLAHALENFSDLEKNQNEDGTWDLRCSNFHDATAAAFTIGQLFPTYRLLERYRHDAVLQEIRTRLAAVLRKAGGGILTGGFHTPNHRWVMGAALSSLYREFGDENYLKEATAYLSEGIDIHQDGSYSEKSIGNYDAIIDMAFLEIAENLGKPELVGYVRKNLALVAKMIQPDGFLYSYNSYRQDSGQKIRFSKYWRVFKRMAVITGDDRWIYTFSCLGGDRIHEINADGIEFDYLTDELLHPVPHDIPEEPLMQKPQGSFCMDHLGIGRIVGKDFAVTLACNNPGLIHVKKGKIDLFVSVYASFFSRGQFKAERLTLEDGAFRLSKTVDYGYIRPFDSAPETKEWTEMDQGTWADVRLFNTQGLYPDWNEIDFGKRKTANVQHLEYELLVRPTEKGLDLDLSVSGCKGVPYKVDLSFDPPGRLFSDYVDLKTMPHLTVFAKQGTYTYRTYTDEISISECFAVHHADAMRGEEAAFPSRFHLCLTGTSEERRSIGLRWN